MAMVINTNIMSLNAQRNLGKSGSTMATAMQRLSSGLRINSAKDDAAGLAISNRMSTQVRGLTQAIRNANDGISISQTAEGAMQEITNNLQRARELAVQSANGSNSASDRAALNDEVTQLVDEIQRAATTTTFNGVNVLNGSFTGNSLQVGSQAGETISFSIANMQTTALGVGSSSSYSASLSSGTLGTTALTAGDVTLNDYQVGAAVDDGVSYDGALLIQTAASSVDGAASGIAVMNAINAVSGDTGVTASVNATTLAGTTITTFTAITAGSVYINGTDIGALTAGTAAVDRGNDMAAAINAVSDRTGVTASADVTTGAVALTASDGRNITIEQADTVTGVITGLGLAGSTANSTSTTRATVTLSSSNASGIKIGGNAEANAGLTAGSTAATVTVGAGVSSIDISTAGGATSALDIIDAALARVDGERASLGAIQNRLESTMSNLGSITENVSAARSRVLDADFAAETAAMTRAQILQQAGVSMLAQANSAPQNVLSLLQ